MEPGRWQRLAERFDHAVAEPGEAARIVAELRMEDAELAAELAALLAEAADGIDADPLAMIVDGASRWLEATEGGTVGPYRLIRGDLPPVEGASPGRQPAVAHAAKEFRSLEAWLTAE